MNFYCNPRCHLLDIHKVSEEHIGMVFEKAKGLVRKVTLELVYEVVDERTREIIQRIEDLGRKREEDFKYLNQKIDHQVDQLRSEIKRLDEKMDSQTGQLRLEIGQLRQEVKEETAQLRQEMNQLRQEMGQMRHEIVQINHRIDTVIQMLSDLLRR